MSEAALITHAHNDNAQAADRSVIRSGQRQKRSQTPPAKTDWKRM